MCVCVCVRAEQGAVCFQCCLSLVYVTVASPSPSPSPLETLFSLSALSNCFSKDRQHPEILSRHCEKEKNSPSLSLSLSVSLLHLSYPLFSLSLFLRCHLLVNCSAVWGLISCLSQQEPLGRSAFSGGRGSLNLASLAS